MDKFKQSLEKVRGVFKRGLRTARRTHDPERDWKYILAGVAIIAVVLSVTGAYSFFRVTAPYDAGDTELLAQSPLNKDAVSDTVRKYRERTALFDELRHAPPAFPEPGSISGDVEGEADLPTEMGVGDMATSTEIQALTEEAATSSDEDSL